MCLEAHLLTAKWFVSRETRIYETQTGLPCMGEPQRAGAASAGAALALGSAKQSHGPPHE